MRRTTFSMLIVKQLSGFMVRVSTAHKQISPRSRERSPVSGHWSIGTSKSHRPIRPLIEESPARLQKAKITRNRDCSQSFSFEKISPLLFSELAAGQRQTGKITRARSVAQGEWAAGPQTRPIGGKPGRAVEKIYQEAASSCG